MNRNIDKLISYVEKTVKEHELAPGCYARWLIQDKDGTRDLSSSEYGCADAANILYTIGKIPRDLAQREACVKELQRMQKEDGRFEEPTHQTIHTTAHCVAALELFDAAPALPLNYHMENFGTPEKAVAFLESLGWDTNPWNESHKGAGFYAAMVLACDMPLEWQDAYFNWLADHVDSATGIGLEGAHNGKRPMIHHLAGWFHYLFNHIYAHRPIPNAEKAVDTMIWYYENDLRYCKGHPFGKIMGFAEIDWIFILNRASMQSGHRREEAKALIREFAEKYLDFLEENMETAYKTRFDDLHMLFGAMCAVAEMQLALPGEIKSTIPLKNVLDRRPFI